MQEIISTVKFTCELCSKEIVMPVIGNATPPFSKEEKLQWVDWSRHFHWIDFHRVCAICGKIVKSGELELAFNDSRIKIHKDYTDEYRQIDQGDRFGSLLMVHIKCIGDTV